MKASGHRRTREDSELTAAAEIWLQMLFLARQMLLIFFIADAGMLLILGVRETEFG